LEPGGILVKVGSEFGTGGGQGRFGREGHPWQGIKVFAGVEPQTVVDLAPHPRWVVSPLKHSVVDASGGQLL